MLLICDVRKYTERTLLFYENEGLIADVKNTFKQQSLEFVHVPIMRTFKLQEMKKELFIINKYADKKT